MVLAGGAGGGVTMAGASLVELEAEVELSPAESDEITS